MQCQHMHNCVKPQGPERHCGSAGCGTSVQLRAGHFSSSKWKVRVKKGGEEAVGIGEMRGRVGEGYKLILQQKSEERELKTEN